MICIAGDKGNMATRYKAILKFLGEEFCGFDAGEYIPPADAYIVCTPTDTHKEVIFKLAHYGKPILCEKPVVKNMADLHHIRAVCEGHGTPFQVVMQYAFLDDTSGSGRSHYDYFKHGNDGLVWDCFQIIALARGKVTLCEDAPIWTCLLNGKKLNIKEMDYAYVTMIAHWLANPRGQTWEQIENAHRKVVEYAGQR